MVNEYVERIKRMRENYNGLCSAFKQQFGNRLKRSLQYKHITGLHIDHCAEAVYDAYRAGDYPHMWEAFAEATRNSGDDYHSDLTSAILRKTITSRLRWNRNPINPDAFNNHAFETMVTDSCGIGSTPMSTLLRLLTESACDETGLTRDNHRAIVNAIANALLAINSTINAHALEALTLNLPYTRHHYIEQHAVAAPHSAENALTDVGRQLLDDEAKPGRTIKYRRHYAPTPEEAQTIADVASRWRVTIHSAEQAGSRRREMVARQAHSHAALTLLHAGALPHDDLATLIDTLQTREEAEGRVTCISVETLDWHPTGKTWFLIDGVGELIDYAAGRMEAQ